MSWEESSIIFANLAYMYTPKKVISTKVPDSINVSTTIQNKSNWGSKIKNFGLFFFSFNIHFYRYLLLLLWGKSKLLFGKHITSRSFGNICKCKQHFLTHHNSFFSQTLIPPTVSVDIVCISFEYSSTIRLYHYRLDVGWITPSSRFVPNIIQHDSICP